MIRSPSLKFLVAHPAHFIALGFGAGLSPIAPGTVGTLVAVPLAVALKTYGNDLGYLCAIVVAFALGVWAAGRTGRDLIGGEVLDGFANRIGGLAEIEIEHAVSVGNHL